MWATATPARMTAIPTLPTSEGWNWKKPRSIHRFEPRALDPITSTMATVAAERGEHRPGEAGQSLVVDHHCHHHEPQSDEDEDDLALEEVLRVGGDVVAGGRSDHVDAQRAERQHHPDQDQVDALGEVAHARGGGQGGAGRERAHPLPSSVTTGGGATSPAVLGLHRRRSKPR